MPRRKPLIAVELSLVHEAIDDLLELAAEFDWQIYDLSISQYNLPTNPSPDGAIFSLKGASRRSLHKRRTFDFPCVRLGSVGHKISKTHPLVLLDRYTAGRMAVEHLAEAGFKDIVAFLKHDWSEADASFKGALDRCEELGITFHRCWLTAPRDEAPTEKAKRWVREFGEHLDRLPRPLALLASNDYNSAKFCFDCQSFGLSVPDDIAVIGIGNLRRICKTASVPLTSVDLNGPRAVFEAAHMLFRMLEGAPPPRTPVVVPPLGVVARHSTDLIATSDPKVAKALRYMWDHLDWPLTIDDIAAEADTPKRTLSRRFQKSLGRGIIEELRRKRLEQVCSLLVDTDELIDDIAQKSGFPTQAHFFRTFKEQIGMTPSDYRTRHRT